MTDPLGTDQASDQSVLSGSSPPALPVRGPSKIIIGLLSLVVLLAGAAGVFLKMKMRPTAKRAEKTAQQVPVDVLIVQSSTHDVRVEAEGTVIAAEEVVVQPELNGRVVWKHAELVPGGKFMKGETLVRIDPRDYQAAVEQQKAALEGQHLALEQERGRRTIAKREWDLFGDAGAKYDDPDGGGKALALREPHLKSAEAAVKAAKSGLTQAKLSLSKTVIQAPFNAFVQTEAVDIGQLVAPSSQLARLVGTDKFWIRVSIPLEKLPSIQVPGLNGTQEGSSTKIFQQVGTKRIERTGRVIRLYGDLDPVGRMARVLVEVDDPLALGHAKAKGANKKEPTEGEVKSPTLPLLLGAFVHVQIGAGTLQNVVEIPRSALRERDEIFIAKDGKLSIRKADIAWRYETTLLVRSGVESGDKIVMSQLAAPLEGMALRVANETPAGGNATSSAPTPAASASSGGAP